MPPAADVVNLCGARRLEEFPERVYQIVAVDVVSDLFAFVAKDPVEASP